MGFEIERKFLVRKDLWYALKKPEGTGITQAYLVNEPGKVIRIRVTDRNGYITIKGLNTGATRPEFEYSIPREEALTILELFPSNKIEKIRYKIEYQGNTWEVDEFFGMNDGLIMAEIELEREDEPFEKPGWIGEEVTDDPRYYNSYLSEHPYNTWK
jgi:CYTH domain-containing protein